jgi:hypothetical protein
MNEGRLRAPRFTASNRANPPGGHRHHRCRTWRSGDLNGEKPEEAKAYDRRALPHLRVRQAETVHANRPSV